MSDAIQALNEVVFKCSERGGDDVNPEDLADHRLKLLELIVEIAGDAIEDHVKASDRAKPRKERVYKEIVRKIAEYFCDQSDTLESAIDTENAIREILASFDIETVDYTGRAGKQV